MLSLRFKLIVVRLLYAILQFNVEKHVLNPGLPHRWSILIKDTNDFMEDLEAEMADCNHDPVIPEVEECDIEESGTETSTVGEVE